MLKKLRLAKEIKQNKPWIQMGLMGTLAAQLDWNTPDVISFQKRTGYLTGICRYDHHVLTFTILYHDPKTQEDITVSTLCYDVDSSSLVVGKQEFWDLHLIEDLITVVMDARNKRIREKETV